MKTYELLNEISNLKLRMYENVIKIIEKCCVNYLFDKFSIHRIEFEEDLQLNGTINKNFQANSKKNENNSYHRYFMNIKR